MCGGAVINKLEANYSLIVITFFAAIQYAFLSAVPASVSNYAFLCITSLIGFILIFVVFINELFRIDLRHIVQSIVLSVLTFIYNLFLLLGSSGLDSTTIVCVVSSYFIFIPVIEFIAFKTKPSLNVIFAIIFVIIGIFLIMDFDVTKLLNRNIFFLILTDIFVALYIVATGNFATGSNPAILSMGQLFFTTILSFIFWFFESRIKGMKMSLPIEPAFWGSVIYVSVFIRGLYTVIQTYAQRYVSPLNTSLIFSTEIIMTVTTTPIICQFFNMDVENNPVTITVVIGVAIMLMGIIVSDPSVLTSFKLKKRSADTNV